VEETPYARWSCVDKFLFNFSSLFFSGSLRQDGKGPLAGRLHTALSPTEDFFLPILFLDLRGFFFFFFSEGGERLFFVGVSSPYS